MSEDQIILRTQGLTVSHEHGKVSKTLIRDVDFFLKKGEILGVTGVSGSGKSLTALAIMGLTGFYEDLRTTGQVYFKDIHMLDSEEKVLSGIRGKDMSLVMQQPDTALNPLKRCGHQLAEALTVHDKTIARDEMTEKCAGLLKEVGLNDYKHILRAYPHQLSGGQIQRLTLAMAMAHRPSVIICDEITSALDSETSKSIIDLLLSLRDKYQTSLIFITHDLLLLRKISQRILVFRNGQITDDFSITDLNSECISAYSKEYLKLASQAVERRPYKASGNTVIVADKLGKTFRNGGFNIFSRDSKDEVLKDISFAVHEGEMLGILGVSGSGKTTLARMLTGLTSPSHGKIVYLGTEISPDLLRKNKTLRKQIQLVYQDALGSLNPRSTIQSQLEEVVQLAGQAKTLSNTEHILMDILEDLDLSQDVLSQLPYMLSGGQRQRIVLAKILLLQPRVIVFDEALASLDIINQVRIMTLIQKLQAKWGFAGIYISHDNRQILTMSHKVLIIKNGRCEAYGTTRDILSEKQSE
jgi:ABC-type glutathione transport system ATPase component